MVGAVYISPKRQILIDIDTQRHFFNDESPVCIRNRDTVLTNICRVVTWAQLHGIHTLSTLQVHESGTEYSRMSRTYPFSLQKPLGTLCHNRMQLDATDGLAWSTDFLQQHDQVLVQKRCYDPFEEPRVDRILTNLPADTCILIGTPVEGAVKATALGLLLRQKHVIIVSDAVGSMDTEASRYAWSRLRSKSITFMRTERLVSMTVPVRTTLLN